jgi:hypothetical protein
MGAKSGIEYEVRHVRLRKESWRDECPVLAEAIGDAAAEGWTLVSMSVPNDNWAILALSRPRRLGAGAAPDWGPPATQDPADEPDDNPQV